MKKKIVCSIFSGIMLCCLIGAGIWAVTSSMATVTLSLPAVTKQTFWGEVSISVDGYHMESEEDKIAPVVKQINYNEESDKVTLNLNGLKFGVNEFGGPKPIEVTFELKVFGYMVGDKTSGITIHLSEILSGEGEDCFSIKGEGLKILTIANRQAFEANNSVATLSMKYTIVQEVTYEVNTEEFTLPIGLNVGVRFSV